MKIYKNNKSILDFRHINKESKSESLEITLIPIKSNETPLKPYNTERGLKMLGLVYTYSNKNPTGTPIK